MAKIRSKPLFSGSFVPVTAGGVSKTLIVLEKTGLYAHGGAVGHHVSPKYHSGVKITPLDASNLVIKTKSLGDYMAKHQPQRPPVTMDGSVAATEAGPCLTITTAASTDSSNGGDPPPSSSASLSSKDGITPTSSPERAPRSRMTSIASNASSTSNSRGFSFLRSRSAQNVHSQQLLTGQVVDPLDWGFPGFLSTEEKEVFDKFKAEIEKRGDAFRSTVYCFGEEEGEAQCLCRWLRARKFKLEDVVTMVEQATELRQEPSKHDFYPDPKLALGVEESIYKSQYPQLYFGRAKSGCPVFISKPGVLNIMGLECITSVPNMHKYQWHSMVHAFGGKLRSIKASDPNFHRFQSICILDLNHLSSDAVNKRVLDLIQHQSHVDGLCFPETLNRLIVVNAPSYFALTWKIIKRWLDPRTNAKVEILAGRSKWEPRLKELIDEHELPKDYGGTSESTEDVIARMTSVSGEGSQIDRRLTETISVRHHASTMFELKPKERMDIVVYTHAEAETVFSVEKIEPGKRGSSTVVQGETVAFKGGETCLQVKIASGLEGPGQYKVIANSDRGRLSTAEHYLLVCNIAHV